MNAYSVEFEAFWKTFSAPKNASKADAFKAWGQKAKARPSQELMLTAVRAYNEWLAKEQAANRGYPHKAHPATWLRGERWEGFLEATDGGSDGPCPRGPENWNGAWERLCGALAEDDIPVADRWLARTIFIPGPPPEIRCESGFQREEIVRRLGRSIQAAFGTDIKLTVS